MSGLVGYDSSDTDQDEKGTRDAKLTAAAVHELRSPSRTKLQASIPNGHNQSDTPSVLTEPLQLPSPKEHLVRPPAHPGTSHTNNEDTSAAQSPYSASRAMIRDLTLPTIPNLDIPPSPPGSLPPELDKKFDHFLKLKIQGVHFNEKLAKSSALKNPSLLRKLMDSAGMEEFDQYEYALSKRLWNPAEFPSWAYKEELAKNQQEVTKKREEERTHTQRESIEFVSATTSGKSSRIATPSEGDAAKGLRGSAAERVMAGLEKDRVRSPQINLASRASNERKPTKATAGVSGYPGRSPVRRKRSRSK